MADSEFENQKDSMGLGKLLQNDWRSSRLFIFSSSVGFGITRNAWSRWEVENALRGQSAGDVDYSCVQFLISKERHRVGCLRNLVGRLAGV